MNWRQKLESWFAAAAFAEEGEHETAMKIAATPIPEMIGAKGMATSLSKTFAAVAFAEEDCHEQALEILYGTRRRNSFLETIGLSHVSVRFGIASAEESFVEAVGLSAVRFRMVTIQL